MPISVRHEGHLFSIEEMTRTGEQHQRDVAAFFSQGPSALDAIVIHDPARIFAMLSCYYKFPWVRSMYAAHCSAVEGSVAARAEDRREEVEVVEGFAAVEAARAEQAEDRREKRRNWMLEQHALSD
jgi:hypothetical protein